MADILEVFNRLIDSDELSCVDRLDIPPREERTAPIPDSYHGGAVGRWLMNDSQLQGKLWLHQAKAMEAAAQGKNIVIATGTASGKSLIFQSAAFRMMDNDDEAVAIIFYPQRALAGDQLKSWRRIAKLAGMGSGAIQKIDGSIKPPQERTDKLKSARIALMTPDICQAWLLREVSNPAHRNFLARVSLIVIDEAHVLEGIFGSNFAYLFRRLCVACALAKSESKRSLPQVIAASATIRAPDKHLQALTGLEFITIGEEEDGSPTCPRSIFHICLKNDADIEETTIPLNLTQNLSQLLSELVDESDDGSFITFIDSRQGAERLSVKVDRDSVKPYRSGYEPYDRAEIENALRNGSLQGVISTSALELGIDIGHLNVGLNVHLPISRKSFRQRLGRVGRQQPGSFGILAEPDVFSRFGTTLGDYYEESVEPSYLYIFNRFMQFAHALCLSDELDMLRGRDKKRVPRFVSWPDGFEDVFDFSYPGSPSARPREFDSINRIGGDSPHLNFPLRNSPEESFKVVHGRSAPGGSRISVAQLSLQQAIREAFPWAIYLHKGQGWRVLEWRNTSFEREIRVARTESPMYPKPMIRTFVNLSLSRDGLVNGQCLMGKNGFLAECHLQINERVEGFREIGERKFYRDLRVEKPSMTPKTRDFRTTGVVMRIAEEWFRQEGVKGEVASAFHELMLREYSISPQDVYAVATNIALIQENGRRNFITDAVVLFDSTHGSLRLTEPAYRRFDDLLSRLEKSDLLSNDIVSNLQRWFEQLQKEDGSSISVQDASLPKGWLLVYKKGSVVAYEYKGIFRDIEITDYELIDQGGDVRLEYLYKNLPERITYSPVKQRMPAEHIKEVGDEWYKVYWNPETGETRESLDDLES